MKQNDYGTSIACNSGNLNIHCIAGRNIKYYGSFRKHDTI